MIQWVALLNCNSVINTKKWCLKDVKTLTHIDEREVGTLDQELILKILDPPGTLTDGDWQVNNSLSQPCSSKCMVSFLYLPRNSLYYLELLKSGMVQVINLFLLHMERGEKIFGTNAKSVLLE